MSKDYKIRNLKIAERIMETIEEKEGKSKTGLADYLGLTQSAISKWTKRAPNTIYIVEICKYLNVSIDYIVTGRGKGQEFVNYGEIEDREIVSQNIAERIMEIIEEKEGKSKTGLADYLGLTPAAVTKWTKTAPSIIYMEDICKYLDVSVFYIMTGRGKGKTSTFEDSGDLTENEKKLLENLKKIKGIRKSEVLSMYYRELNKIKKNIPSIKYENLSFEENILINNFRSLKEWQKERILIVSTGYAIESQNKEKIEKGLF